MSFIRHLNKDILGEISEYLKHKERVDFKPYQKYFEDNKFINFDNKFINLNLDMLIHYILNRDYMDRENEDIKLTIYAYYRFCKIYKKEDFYGELVYRAKMGRGNNAIRTHKYNFWNSILNIINEKTNVNEFLEKNKKEYEALFIRQYYPEGLINI